MTDSRYDMLKLENQVCFPLYACSRESVKLYRPYLEQLDLTYTQYIAMMVIWEEKITNVKSLGQRLYLDSGTLTPVLKSLEAKGYVNRYRSTEDERILLVELTDKGEALREAAVEIPAQVKNHVKLDPQELLQLHQLLYKLLEQFRE